MPGSPSMISESSKTSSIQHKPKTCSEKSCVNQAKKFLKNIKNFIRQCKMPSGTDFKEILKGHVMGVVLLGTFAFFIKVIHIPVNNIITAGNTN